MELELLASTLAILARQAAPHLQEWGGQATEAALTSYAGEKAKQAAQALGLLKPKLERKPIAAGSVKELAEKDLADAEAAEAQATLERQLVLLLEGDQKLRSELEEKLEGVEVRADRHSVAVAGDLTAEQVVVDGQAIQVTGGTAHFHQSGPAPANAAAGPDEGATSDEGPRSAYLRWVMERAGYVMLGGVDPAVGRDKDRRLHLAAVYTALRTRTPRRIEVELEAAGKARSREAMGREESPLSALEQLDRHDRLVLLGDPGSGKSTFLNFVALCLAGESLPDVEALGLDVLTLPLPKDDGSDGEERQAWSHKALVPVRVVLRDFAARGLPEDVKNPVAGHLRRFLEAELAEGEQTKFSGELEKALASGEALVLLDGLDEVPEAAQRRELICDAVLRFVEAYSRCRFVVTSRTYAFEKKAFHLPGFEVAELAPFGDGQIRRFARRWYSEVAELRELRPEDARGRATLLERAIFASSRLRELAARPLLLTLMASLHAFRGGSLPEEREELYGDTVDLLLDVWEQKRRQRDASGQLLLDEPRLTEWLKVERADVLGALQELAYEVHRSQPELVGTADVPAGALVERLMKLPCKTQGEDVNPKRLAEYLSERSGILAERSDGVYTFPHRTFQEYLAARHLVDGDFDYDEIARDGRKDPNLWREVILLAAARIGPLAVWELADALAFGDDPLDIRADAWGLHLAGQAVADTAKLEKISKRNHKRLRRLRRRLAGLLESPELPAGERARAGTNLAHLGDPRFDEAKWFLPADATAGFIAVPEGEYTIGSAPEQDTEALESEQPQHTVTLSPFWLARWPVTVSQFQAFAQASGLEVGDKDALAGVANHPVVFVSWDEAKAYCQWLTERLIEVASEGASAADSSGPERFWRGVESGEMRAKLPTESQWEAAARGPEARLYPWGREQPTEEHANFTGTRGTTTTVGIYPRGRGPVGTEDQAGNVWEWCADVWNSNAYAERAGGSLVDPWTREGEIAVRVLRGGSWGYPSLTLRAAVRLGNWLGFRLRNFGFRVCVSGPEHD